MKGQVDANSGEVPDGQEDGTDWLTTSEFILLNLSRHYSIVNFSLFKYVKPAKSMNIFQVLIAYVMVGIPVGYMEIVLGQYTNMGMFNIKHLMPIAQGMSYTFCLQVLATTTLCVILMTQYLIYAMLSLVVTMTGNELPWLACPANFTDICYVPTDKCPGPEPCINTTRHLSTYVYWDEIFMRHVLPPEEADIGLAPLHRLVALMFTWAIVWGTMTWSLKTCIKFIKTAFIVLLIYKCIQFNVIIFILKYIVYLPYMINLSMSSFVNINAWKHAIRKVTVGMGLGDYSYILFGVLSKRDRMTGSLMWFCGFVSFSLTAMDHIVLSGATYYLCDEAKLPVEKRFLLFRPNHVQHELGVLPIVLSELMSSSMWNAMYFLQRFTILLFHVMLNYTFLQFSLYQRYPVLKAYAVYIKPLFCIFGCGIGILFDSREAYAFRYDIQRVVIEFCDQFNIIIITVIVFYIYGVTKFCDDVHFMTGQEPAKFWMIGWVISPVAIMISLPMNLFDVSHIFYAYRIITIAVFYTPYIIFLTITVVHKIYRKQLLTLLRSTDDWGPADPVLKEYRKSFNPRVESKRKNKAYKCAHKCLIEGKPPSSDEEEDGVILT